VKGATTAIFSVSGLSLALFEPTLRVQKVCFMVARQEIHGFNNIIELKAVKSFGVVLAILFSNFSRTYC
jgi:hypothetical protein